MIVSALVGGTLQLQWKVLGSNPNGGGECEAVEERDGCKFDFVFFFFSPCLIMNLRCKGKGAAATPLFVFFSRDPREHKDNVAIPPTCWPPRRRR